LGVLSSVGLTDQDYRKIVELRLIGEKVNAAIASTVPTITEQIKFKYIRINLTDVPTVTASVNADGFDKVYREVLSNTYPITSVIASETFDWVPHDEISSDRCRYLVCDARQPDGAYQQQCRRHGRLCHLHSG
jgi:hypothetical protein